MKRLWRVVLLLPCLTSLPLAAGAQDLPTSYLRGDAGVAVEVPWFAVRVGRVLGGGAFAADAGVGGSPTGRGYFSVTGGLEARLRSEKQVSPFGRLELGFMSQSQGQSYGVVSLGAGLSFRVNRSWSARLGLMKSIQGEGVSGPDWLFAGMEYRW